MTADVPDGSRSISSGDDDAPSGRNLCSILDDMRACFKTRNFSYLMGLIEEAQSRAWRMEDGLGTARTAARIAWEALTDIPEGAAGPDVKKAVDVLVGRFGFAPPEPGNPYRRYRVHHWDES